MGIKVIRSEKEKGIHYEYDPSDKPLGEGGMGIVYRGWRFEEYNNLQREVAIKELKLGLKAQVIERARREAAVRLKNDNLIEMIDFVEVSEKDELGFPSVRYYVISEFLHGVTLDNMLNGRVTDYRGEVLPFVQQMYGQYMNDAYHLALTVVRCVLSGLMALHDAGYIHRDIDPSNIMITSDGHVKLIDFGIAKDIRGALTDESSYTQVGQIIGKPKYGAPEQLQGMVSSLGVPTDLYSVGILLFQLVVGHVPFDGEMGDVVYWQIHKNVPLNEVKLAELRKVLKKATRKDRRLRYQSAAEFRVAIDKLVPLSYPGRIINVNKVIAVTAAVLVIALGSWYFLSLPSSDEVQQEDAHQQPLEEVAKVEAGNKEKAILVANDKDKALLTEAVQYLKDETTARKGWDLLNQLSNSASEHVGYQATFLLSRLYFDNPADEMEVPDSIRKMKQALKGIVQSDNRKAHELLLKAVGLNGNDYHSLYELGCNYMSRNKRGVSKDLHQAEIFLQKAQSLAQQAGDEIFQERISNRLSKLE